MSTPRRRSTTAGGGWLAAAAALALAGTWLLYGAPAPSPDTAGDPVARQPAPSMTATPSSSTPRPSGAANMPGGAAPAHRADPSPASTPSSPSESPAPDGSAGGGRREVLPVQGEGRAADAAVQRALEDSAPSDLAPELERRLVALGRAVWIAEVTGAGRERWPGFFLAQDVVRPYTRVRIQAAIARRTEPHAGAPSRVRVQLVWAGASPGGQMRTLRPAAVTLTRSGSEEGGAAWKPVR